jgi:hypothetical protein
MDLNIELKLYYNLSFIWDRTIPVIEAKGQLPSMWERIRKCRFCGLEVVSSALGYAENPYCANCLAERAADSTKNLELISWNTSGDYFIPTNLAQKTQQ